MAKRYEITAEELKDLYYGKNMSLNMIAQMKHVSPSCISAAMERNNVSRRSDSDGLKFAWEQGRQRSLKCNLSKEQLMDLYCEKSMSTCQISDICHVHNTTIVNMMKRYGIKRRSPQERQQLAIKSGRRKPRFKFKISYDELYDLYWNKNKTAKEIGVLCGVSENPVYRKMKLLGISMRTVIEAKMVGRELGKYHYKRGELTPRWKGGRRIDESGYVHLKIQPDNLYYIMADHSNYVLEHRYVMAQVLGRPLMKWEQPHHRDGNKMNNDPSNLELRIGNHGKGASLKSYEEELLKRLAELYKENELFKATNSQKGVAIKEVEGEKITNGTEKV